MLLFPDFADGPARTEGHDHECRRFVRYEHGSSFDNSDRHKFPIFLSLSNVASRP